MEGDPSNWDVFFIACSLTAMIFLGPKVFFWYMDEYLPLISGSQSKRKHRQ